MQLIYNPDSSGRQGWMSGEQDNSRRCTQDFLKCCPTSSVISQDFMIQQMYLCVQQKFSSVSLFCLPINMHKVFNIHSNKKVPTVCVHRGNKTKKPKHSLISNPLASLVHWKQAGSTRLSFSLSISLLIRQSFTISCKWEKSFHL